MDVKHFKIINGQLECEEYFSMFDCVCVCVLTEGRSNVNALDEGESIWPSP